MTFEEMRERNRGLVMLARQERRERITELEARVAALEEERATAMNALAEERARDAAIVSAGERVTTALEGRIHERALVADLTGKTAFLAQRVAYHLAHGCDTAERARELALAEWDVGVMGVKING